MLSDCAFRARLARPGQRELFDYWREIAGTRDVPARADFDPVKVPHLLPDLGIIDLRGGFDDGRFRLAGTRLRDVYGREVTGLRMSEVFAGDLAAPWHRIHTRIAAEAVSAQGVVPGPASGRDHIVLFWLRLPLSDDGIRVDRILCHDVAEPRDSIKLSDAFTVFCHPKRGRDRRMIRNGPAGAVPVEAPVRQCR